MPPTTAPAPPDGNVLRQRLAALRRRIRRTAILRGASWLVLATAVVAVAACLLDSLWPLDSLARAAVLVAWLVGAGLLFWRFLYRPLSQRSDDLSLALRVEQRFPVLNDALASTVQFLDAPASEGGDSAALRREAVKRTLARSKGFDFNRVVDARGLRRTAAAAALAGTAAVTLLLLFPKPALSALGRLLNPFNNRSLPPASELVLEPEPPADRVGKGEAYEINGHVAGALPPGARAKVIVRVDGYSTREYATDVTPDGTAPDGRPRAKLSFRLDKVESSFHFRVRYNDAEKGEYAVRVLPPPMLANLGKSASPQLQLLYPRYTGLPSPQEQTPGVGDVDAVLGTSVVLRAAADRPLRAAWVDYPVIPQTAAPALGVAGALASAPLARIRADAELDDGRMSFTVRFRPGQSGVYALHFEDDTGLAATRLFGLTVRDDPAPVVQLDRPSKARDVLTVLPTAVLPLQATAEDPLYGLRSVYLEYHLQADGSPRQRLVLHDPATVAAEVLAPFAGPAVKAVAPPLRPTRLEFRTTLAAASLRRPDGSTPREGDVFLLRAAADDWDDVSPSKEPGRSPEVEIHIVGRNELDIAVAQDEGDLQKELARLREKELQALQHAEDAEGKLKEVEKIQPKEADQSDEAKKRREEVEKLQKDIGDDLVQAQQLQREIEEGVSDPKNGARARARRLLEALKANGEPPNTPLRDRMERAEQELGRIADNELRQIDPKLTEAMKEAELLDPKNKAERQALRQEQTRDLERQAKEAEQEAERADGRAEAAKDAAGKERERQEAEQDRKRASALRKEAERLRADADQDRPAAAPREDVAKAEEMQSEVARTLNDLQSYSSTREAKVEAGRILQEQRKLEADAAKLQDLLGKDAKDLTDAQRAELDELRDNQKRLEERTQQLLSRMQHTADAPKELEKLAAEQEELRQEIKDARGQRELEPLAKKEKDLADRTKAAADEMKRLGAEQAAAALQKAAGAMERDAERLQKGQRPENDDARKGLQDARTQKDSAAGARELKEALDKALQAGPDQDEAGLQGDMKRAAEELARNQLGDARKDQDRAANKLQDMLGQFRAQEEERHEGDLDQLAKKLAEKQKELEKLAQEQDELKKKIKDAKDEKELAQLAKKQKELADRVKETADELKRLGAERAGAAAKQAADAMEQNADRLEKGQKPENADLALDRLQDAQDEADDAQQDAADQLEREKQARIAEEVQGLKDRQEALNQEAARLHDTLARNEVRRDVLLNSVGGLRDAQNGLAGETDALAKKELADAPVLLRLTLRAAESMTDAGNRLDEGMKAKPASIGDAALQAQQDASHRLALALDALKSEDQALPQSGGGQAGGPAGPGGDPTTQPDSVPPVAQLKLLRAMQKEVNDRTAAFQKDHPDPAKYGDKEKAELEHIHREQQDVVDLVEEFRHPTPIKDEDKK